jgi:hypothetical protein
MQKIIIVFFIILSKTGIAQSGIKNILPGITYNTIYFKSIMLPNLAYKDAKVKTVTREVKDFHKQQNFRNLSFYSTSGNLIYEKNWDSTYVIGGETISVNEGKGIYEITRKISRFDYYKIDLSKLSSNQFLPSYLNSGIEKMAELRSDTLTFFESLYWMKDSSVFYKLFVNGKFIDSGVAITEQTYLKDNTWNCTSESKVYNNVFKDSIVRCGGSPQYAKDIFVDTFRIKNGNIVEVKKGEYRGNEFYSRGNEFRKYDNFNHLSEIEYISDGILWKRKLYTHLGNKQEVIITENYEKGAIVLKTVTDLNGNNLIVERYTKKNLIPDGKEIYSYNDKGLLTQLEIWWGGELEEVIKYTYTYY